MTENNGKEKFELEVDGKRAVCLFARPTLRHRKMFLQWAAEKEAVIKAMQVEGKNNAPESLSLMIASQDLRNKILLQLMEKNDAISAIEDFDNVANEDMERLWGWFDKSVGLARSEKEEAFLPKSGK